MSNPFTIYTDRISSHVLKTAPVFIPLYRMTYHTSLLPAPIKQTTHEHETILINSYVTGRKFYLILKRSFDVIFSILFIALVLSWLVPLTSLLIVLDSPGPVFFVQRRMGKNGRTFRCLKFRTMVVNDEAHEKQAEDNDDRITKFGRFLRNTNIDEFPQFINVLAGNMSIIGPRPHMLSDCTRFSFVIPAYKFRTLMRPGITGLAQVKGYHGPTIDYESIFTRYHWDAEYIRSASFLLDIKILCLTFLQTMANLVYLIFFFFRSR